MSYAKSQSALEYLTTYGWAILIIAVVFFVLFETNILGIGTQGFAFPGSCRVVNTGGSGQSQYLTLQGTCNGAVPKFVADFSSQGYAMTPNVSSLHSLSSFTVVVWVARKSATGAAEPILQSNGTIVPNFELSINSSGNNGVTFSAAGAGNHAGSASSASGSAAALNNWYFIAGTFNSSTVSVYLDGALAGSGTTAVTGLPSSGNIQVLIGHTMSPSAYFPGYISNIQVYDRQLSPSEIRTLYVS